MPRACFRGPGLDTIYFSRAPLRPERPAALAQELLRSAAGVPIGAPAYQKEEFFTLAWSSLPQAEADRLQAMMLACGSSIPFVYDDVNGSSRWLYFESPRMWTRELVLGRVAVSVSVRAL